LEHQRRRVRCTADLGGGRAPSVHRAPHPANQPASDKFAQAWSASDSGRIVDLEAQAPPAPKPEPEDDSFNEAWGDDDDDDGANSLDYSVFYRYR
jgi:hypothetical protein